MQAYYTMVEDQEGDRYSTTYNKKVPHELMMNDVDAILEQLGVIDAHTLKTLQVELQVMDETPKNVL